MTIVFIKHGSGEVKAPLKRSFIVIYDLQQDFISLVIKSSHFPFHHALYVYVLRLSKRCFLEKLFPQVMKKRCFGFTQPSRQSPHVTGGHSIF